jgi:hypothetical protein
VKGGEGAKTVFKLIQFECSKGETLKRGSRKRENSSEVARKKESELDTQKHKSLCCYFRNVCNPRRDWAKVALKLAKNRS